MVPARVPLVETLLQTSVESFVSLLTRPAPTCCCAGSEDMQYPTTVIFVEPRSKHLDFAELRAKHFTLLDAQKSPGLAKYRSLPAPAHCRKGPSTVIT